MNKTIKEEYQNLKKNLMSKPITSSKVLVENNKIYKIFKNDPLYLEEKERNIDFFIKNRIINTPKIYQKIYKNDIFIGYTMEYIPNSLTFKQSINSKISYKEKELIIRDVYEALKQLHNNNITIGDIHSDNLLISEEKIGYIIDLEEVRTKEDDFKFKQLYLIKPSSNENKINISSKYTDNIKLMISSLSLLLEKDLEEYISKKSHDINIENLYKNEIEKLKDDKLNDYFLKIINNEEIEYFSDYYFQNCKVKN